MTARAGGRGAASGAAATLPAREGAVTTLVADLTPGGEIILRYGRRRVRAGRARATREPASAPPSPRTASARAGPPASSTSVPPNRAPTSTPRSVGGVTWAGPSSPPRAPRVLRRARRRRPNRRRIGRGSGNPRSPLRRSVSGIGLPDHAPGGLAGRPLQTAASARYWA